MSKINRTKSLRSLRRKIAEYFSTEEIQTVAFDLSIDWEELPGSAKTPKVQALITYATRLGRLDELLELLRETKPKVDWPSINLSPTEQVEVGADLSFENVQDAALNNYFEKMSLLVLSKRQSPMSVEVAAYEGEPKDEYELYDQGVRAIAFALTNVVCNMVTDRDRLKLVEKFLFEAGLIKIRDKVFGSSKRFGYAWEDH